MKMEMIFSISQDSITIKIQSFLQWEDIQWKENTLYNSEDVEQKLLAEGRKKLCFEVGDIPEHGFRAIDWAHSFANSSNGDRNSISVLVSFPDAEAFLASGLAGAMARTRTKAKVLLRDTGFLLYFNKHPLGERLPLAEVSSRPGFP